MTTDGVLTDFAGLPAPRTPAARAVLETCAEFAEPWLLNHSLRAYFLAVAHAVQARIDHETELLFVAATLHDLALTVPFDSHRLAFEEAGGNLARVFAAGAGWPADRRERLAEVIVLHMRPPVTAGGAPEAHLLQIGVGADVSGRGLDAFDPAFRSALLSHYPRAGFGTEFLRLMQDEARRKPSSAAATLLHGGLAQRISANPLDR
jgi:HD domain